MRKFFLSIDLFHKYKWSDYFTPPTDAEVLNTLVQAKKYNTRITIQNYKHRLTLPVLGGIGCIFVLHGSIKITMNNQKTVKSIELREGEFCRIPYGKYIYEHSDECSYITMVLYEEFPKETRKKIAEHYGKKI